MILYTALPANCVCQVYPTEYAYHSDLVYKTDHEGISANCRTYPSSLAHPAQSEYYIHCDGTQLRLTDSDFGSEQYTTSDYYVWTNWTYYNRQLLFIFPTRVNLTTITLHYYSDSSRGLPRLRFYAVPDDFDVWDAPTLSYSHVEVAAVSPVEQPAGHRNVTLSFSTNTMKILLFVFRSSLRFALSEVQFFNNDCCNYCKLALILIIIIILASLRSIY